MKRKNLEGVSNTLAGSTGIMRMSVMGSVNTYEIATQAIAANNITFNNNSNMYGDVLFSPMIALMMDMSFAHYDGYLGKKIYYIPEQDEEIDGKKLKAGEYYFPRRTWREWKSSSCTDVVKFKEVEEDDGDGGSKKVNKPFYERIERFRHAKGENDVDEDPKKGKMYHEWDKQVEQTEMAAVRYPFRILPMYHIEPRRYLGIGDSTENWRDQLDKIATESQSGLYVGIKMYCSMGFQPKDPKIPFLNDLSYYKACIAKKIPILCHHSDKGLLTHDMEFYFYNQEPVESQATVEKRGDYPWEDYYQETYVHPQSWEKVLNNEGVKELHLCLAHFGGGVWEYHNYKPSFWRSTPKQWQTSWVDKLIKMINSNNYPNLYVDISYFVFWDFNEKFQVELIKNKDENLINRILFGTDWFMVLGDKTHSDFTKMAFDCIKNASEVINAGKEKTDEGYIDLWKKFTFENPMRFYGLHNESKLTNIKAALESKLRDFESDYLEFKENKTNICTDLESNFNSLKAAAKMYSNNQTSPN
ncbi:MAG: amidohydrolase [Proteobacteria bacterium]|nr:amidohydrolase [Pseudomonadota bacterium]